MMHLIRKRIYKRKYAMIMTIILLVLIPLLSSFIKIITANANTEKVESLFPGNLLKQGSNFQYYGKTHDRTGMWAYKVGNMPAFCLNPNKHMNKGVQMETKQYNIGVDALPYGITEEKALYLFYALMSIGAADGVPSTQQAALFPAGFIMGQSAVWAIMSDDWDVEKFKNEIQTKIIPNAVDPSIGPQIMGWLDEFVKNAKEYCNPFVVPEFASLYKEKAPTYRMRDNGDGTFSYTFPIDPNVWQQTELTYENLPPNWRYDYSDTKDSLTFTYKGSNPSALIEGKFPKGSKGEQYSYRPNKLYISTPLGAGAESKQPMIKMTGAKEPWAVYFNLGNSRPVSGAEGTYFIDYEQYEHNETFDRDYKIELNKYCSETGNSLQDSTFEIREKFDFNQLEGTNLDKEQFEQDDQEGTFESLSVCKGRITTDNQGHWQHSDHKTYQYRKTYCGGHPEPVIYEYQADEDADEDERDKIDEKNEELEEKAWEEWQECVDWCIKNCDFHGEAEGSAKERCQSDRDEAFQNYIELKRTYQVREVSAREGYIQHGVHNEDSEIETVLLSSSQKEGEVLTVEISKNNVITSYVSMDSFDDMKHEEIGKTLQTEHEKEPQKTESEEMETKSEETKESEDIKETEEVPDEMEKEDKKRIYNLPKTKLPVRNSKKRTRSKSSWSWEEQSLRSEIPLIIQSDYDSSSTGYTFEVYDHRTEGEIQFNKRDLELYRENPDKSYGKTQGEATLEGAVYGLYAYDDIIHPDGKTGKVFSAGELVSIAATDKNGDGSFFVITEQSDTSKNVPNLYLQNTENNGNPWIGRPLLLGNYYIQEITRSEGYELSRIGIHLNESNRTGAQFELDGRGAVSTEGLTHRFNEWDGSWNDFTVNYKQTKNGFDVTVSGYPEGSSFYRVDTKTEEKTETVVTGFEMDTVCDSSGNPKYETALGGEYKLDESNNRIIKTDDDGNPLIGSPSEAAYRAVSRLEGSIEAIIRDPVTDPEMEASEEIDSGYITSEVNSALSASGYKSSVDGYPWKIIELKGKNNGKLIDEVLKYCSNDAFWDACRLDDVYEEEDTWYGIVRYGYRALTGSAVYDDATERLFVKKPWEASGSLSCYYLVYEKGEYQREGMNFTVTDFRAKNPVVYGDPILYEPVPGVVYETYKPGEFLLDQEGNPIPVRKQIPITETVTMIRQYETETLIPAEYHADTQEYVFHVDNEVNWNTETSEKKATFRAKAPKSYITHQGVETAYADYLREHKNAAVSVSAAGAKPIKEGTYIQVVNLNYPGQTMVYQDKGTRTKPVQVLQRVIKQSIKVTKDISQDSYEQYNTYKIHRDPFTVLFGGYRGALGAKALKGFAFRVYPKPDLEAAGKLERKKNGSWNYEKFFKEHKDIARPLALEWDKPDKDMDGDLTTVHANLGSGTDEYWGISVPLPYGTYIIEEVQPVNIPNKHYQIDLPKEVVLPFVPQTNDDGTINEHEESTEYLYDSEMTPEEMEKRYHIRFLEESHVIKAHNNDGDFKVYKYGLDPDLAVLGCGNQTVDQYYKSGSISEDSGIEDGVYYKVYYDRDKSIIGYGMIRDHVTSMKGKTKLIDRVYAPALVPWSVLEPKYGQELNDGAIGNREPGIEADGSFNFVAYALQDFENTFYSSRLRIEKLDSETGENILHDQALFHIYAAKRDIKGQGGNSVTGTGEVLYDELGVPVYDESEQIFLRDETGLETGIFKAYSTEREILTERGWEKQVTGYIETYEPLGAGAYVLVEMQPPKGYARSKPVAFEVYSDKTTYDEKGEQGNKKTAARYQYAVILGEEQKYSSYDVDQIKVYNEPSKMELYKVEDGDSTITYQVRGTKEYLEARNDVRDIRADLTQPGQYIGTADKIYDEWSENLVEGTKDELNSQEGVKVIYDQTGKFSGHGIRFDIPVAGAQLKLYEGLAVKKDGIGGYEGVHVTYRDGTVVSVIAEDTGYISRILPQTEENAAAGSQEWEMKARKMPPVTLLFYDLKRSEKEKDYLTGDWYILDERGNRVCLADQKTGMAYTIDEFGNQVAYAVDESGRKKLVKSIVVYEGDEGPAIYRDLKARTDENGLPVYYESGYGTKRLESWITGAENPHKISRLPFGAYILEESRVPLENGYIKTPDQGFVFQETKEVQKYFIENDFTKAAISKIDRSTQKEIQDAEMTCYYAERMEDGADPRGYHLEIAKDRNGLPRIWAKWLSGYAYDDNGNLKIGGDGNRIPVSLPHWMDHIPVGDYIIKETRVPVEKGYVGGNPMEVTIEETGEVQTWIMENDYTQTEIRKLDGDTGQPVTGARLGLYKAITDEAGKVLYHPDGSPQTGLLLMKWTTSKGKTGEPRPVPGTRQAVYYPLADGGIHIDYLPVGTYVLKEEETPYGYTAAQDQLIRINEIGGLVQIQQFVMKDWVPRGYIHLEKTDKDNGKKLAGARFLIRNETLKQEVQELITGSGGTANSHMLPIGFMDADQHFILYQYSIQESAPPKGYQADSTRHVFQFQYLDETVKTVPYLYHAVNEKKPGEEKPVPETEPSHGGGNQEIKVPPKEEEKKEVPEYHVMGLITAFYQASVKPVWENLTIGKSKNKDRMGIPATGDPLHAPAWYAAGLAVSLGGLALWAGKKYKRLRMLLGIGIITVIMVLGCSMAVHAEEKNPEMISISSDVFGEEEEQMPDPVYTDETGARYALTGYERIPVTLGPVREALSRTVTYRQVEGKEQLPDKIEVMLPGIKGQDKGAQELALVEAVPVNEQWVDGFSFPVTFHVYGADSYRLGDLEVALGSESPVFEGYEKELLSAIGADPADYSIQSLSWDGEAYLDENGQRCRNAVAAGRKRVVDYEADYGGTIELGQKEGYRIMADYSLICPVRSRIVQEQLPAQQTIRVEKLQEPVKSQKVTWLKLVTETAVITLWFGTAAFILSVLIWSAAMLWQRKSGRRKRRNLSRTR